MIEFDAFALLRPWWLLALPAAAALGVVAVRRAAGVDDWRKAVDPHLFAALARRGAVVAGRGRGALPAALACAAIALALSGPAIERPGAETFRNLDVAVVIVDLSRSVTESPRFTDARLAAFSAVQAAGSRQAAVIVYAGDAYLAAPLTSDHRALETLISSLDGDTVPDVGTAPTAALALARATLRQAGALGGDVALVSDGGGLDEGAESEARALAADGHALSTLYVKPAPQAPRREGEDGRAALDALAAAGGGVAATVEAPAPALERLSRSAAERLGPGLFSSIVWLDLGRALLLFACAPVLLLFRRSG
ncbi:hypothetical protein GCM10008171_12710 [Methylopila jiangsuensis]|uniref:VWFA domain-containing protein n=1 Tax=Methylopila jiangsuensis TaxID=586230 RepID=A0A9W6N3F5_9HYPH|nr:VWA domain-containing protein [Methylopila jiangsuensis]MDR6286254.1 Ca-activated chloride channel family protein [Methylopila jiangsuensis]GLK76017.1 hypothetical protein GCM10008171_12710 [Methylopila jiangsuensis]